MICTPNFVSKLEFSFSNIFSKKQKKNKTKQKQKQKNARFDAFLHENHCFLIFYTQNDNFLIFRGIVYNVIKLVDGNYFLVSIEKEHP